MSYAAPPTRGPCPGCRRKRWLILPVALALLIALLAGGHAWMNRPAGRAGVLLGELRRLDSPYPSGIYDRFRRALGIEDCEPRYMYQIVRDLVDLNSPVVPTLLDAMQDPSPTVRCGVAEALGLIGDERAVPALIEALAKDQHPGVRSSAGIALGEIGGPATAAPLVAALKDSEPSVRSVAAASLGEINETPAVPLLVELLNDSSDIVRSQAVQALGNLGDRRAVPALLAAAEDRNQEVRRWAVWELGRIGDPQALPAVIQALDDRVSDVRLTAIKALGEIGGPEANLRVLAALEDSDARVRQWAVAGLGNPRGPDAVPLLVKALSDADKGVRRNAADKLRYAGDSRAIESLLAAARDADFFVQLSALSALVVLGAPESGDAAVALLQDPNEVVRYVAAYVCGLRGRSEGLPLLRQALGSQEPGMAAVAVVALVRLGIPEAREALRQAANSASHPAIRRLSERALADGLLPALDEAVLTRNSHLKIDQISVRLLMDLNDPAALPALEEARKTGRPHVREEAARAIEHLRRASRRRPRHSRPSKLSCGGIAAQALASTRGNR
jgi:HEAT repeat protein